MPSPINEIVKLRAENDLLRAEIDDLRKMLEPSDCRFIGLGLTPTEQRIAAFIFNRSPFIATFVALYSVGGMENNETPNHQLKVYVSKIRKKLKSSSVVIRCQFGVGYWMDNESKARLSALMQKGEDK